MHLTDASLTARDIYKSGYSLNMLRDKSLRTVLYDKHYDLWKGLVVVFSSLENGSNQLALPALGGLFRKKYCENIVSANLGNSFLLSAIQRLSFFRKDGALVKINYRVLKQVPNIYK